MGNEIRTEMSEGEKTRDIATNFMDSYQCLHIHMPSNTQPGQGSVIAKQIFLAICIWIKNEGTFLLIVA